MSVPEGTHMPGSDERNVRGWIVATMLAVFMAINFMDKAILGIVAKPVMAELNLAPAEFGLIASSFFLLFSVSAICFGFFADRMSSKTVLMVLAAIWGIAQLPLAFAASVPLLLFSRILLGVGEGPAYPLALHACYKWFHNDQRNLPSAVIYQGVTVGLLISGPVLTFITVRYGWHAAFLALAVSSVVWMALWAFLGREGAVTDRDGGASNTSPGGGVVPYRTLLTDRTFLGNMALYWTAYWVFAVMFTWIPSYLETVLNYTTTETGWMFMFFTGINVPIVLGGSWLSQRLLEQGVPSLRARGWLSCAFVMLGGLFICLSIQVGDQPLLHVALLAVGCNLPQLTFVLSATIVAEIVPAGQRSAMMSVNSALATTGGLFAPALMGWLIGRSATPAAGFEAGFLVAALLAIAVGLLGLLTIDPTASRRRLAERAASPV
jgi:MFS family permease